MTQLHQRFVRGSLTVLLVAGSAVAIGPTPAHAQTSATIDGNDQRQEIEGFGFSEFFGRTNIMQGSEGLPEQRQREVLDLLLDTETGAGMSILRLGIGSTPGTSIQPNDPGGPDAPPQYQWDGDDDGQVWLAQEAQDYGVERFYADAWSAPGYMKTNGDEANGGTLCGLSGASCPSGDWREAYAEYLIQYTRFYEQEGIDITDIGFTNEPEYDPDYSSMLFTPEQAAEFATVIGPLAQAEGLRLACCDSFGWNQQRAYTQTIEADPQAREAVQLHTGHTYASPVDGPLPTDQRVWMSEWNPDGDTWNESWDDGSGYDGFTIAQAIHDALTLGEANAYVYWYGASTDHTRGFIQLDGGQYHVSKRLWAMANYSRFIRPEAHRIGATTSDNDLQLSAYENTDGSVVVAALNTGGSASSVSYALPGTGITTGTATPYLTNSANSTAAQPAVGVDNGSFTATVPGRSLVTYVVESGGTPSPTPTESPTPSPTPTPTDSPTPPPTGGCSVTYDADTWNSGLVANLTIANTGDAPIDGWSLEFPLPDGQTITNGWNADYGATSGQVTAENLSYNATIPAGDSVSIGFQATHTGDASPPGSFTLNGTTCTVG